MASGDLYTKIPTVVNSGKGIPDLTIVDVARIPMFYAQGLLESMKPVLDAAPEIKKENYKAAVWDTGTFDGEQYAVPLDMGVIWLTMGYCIFRVVDAWWWAQLGLFLLAVGTSWHILSFATLKKKE